MGGEALALPASYPGRSMQWFLLHSILHLFALLVSFSIDRSDRLTLSSNQPQAKTIVNMAAEGMLANRARSTHYAGETGISATSSTSASESPVESSSTTTSSSTSETTTRSTRERSSSAVPSQAAAGATPETTTAAPIEAPSTTAPAPTPSEQTQAAPTPEQPTTQSQQEVAAPSQTSTEEAPVTSASTRGKYIPGLCPNAVFSSSILLPVDRANILSVTNRVFTHSVVGFVRGRKGYFLRRQSNWCSHYYPR